MKELVDHKASELPTTPQQGERGTFSHPDCHESRWQPQRWETNPTALTLSSSQVSYVSSPCGGALPVHTALQVTLLSVTGLEGDERVEAALTPLPLLPTRMVEIQLRSQRPLRCARLSPSKGSLCTTSFSVLVGETPRCEGTPYFPPLHLAMEKGSLGSGKGGCWPGCSAYLCLVMRLM